jgi:transposase
MQLLKHVIGIDIAKDSFTAASGSIDIQQTKTVSSARSYKNTPGGFASLEKIIRQEHQTLVETAGGAALPLWIVMEATGIYYERLALWLLEHGYAVVIVLPNNIKHFARSDNRKSKTDAIDAVTITCYGLEKTLKPWQPASALMIELKSLTREHDASTRELTEVRNRLHALEHAAHTPKPTIKRLRQQRDLLKKQLQQIETEIKELIEQDPELKESVECMSSIKGVAMMTTTKVLAETDNFALVERGSQLISFSGLDPVLQDSGSYKGKVMISHKGNRMIRSALYMPALAAIRYNPAMRQFYNRLLERGMVKKKAIVAVMNKLLRLMYTLWKKRERFDPTYGSAALAA